MIVTGVRMVIPSGSEPDGYNPTGHSGTAFHTGTSLHVGTALQMAQYDGMATRARRSQRRTEALSRERIVENAVELLDSAGEGGLTFRALTEHLATGPGAIYWHVANKSELLGAATEAVVAAALAIERAESADSPQDEIRAVALGLSHRSMNTHGSPHSSRPSSPATPRGR